MKKNLGKSANLFNALLKKSFAAWPARTGVSNFFSLLRVFQNSRFFILGKLTEVTRLMSVNFFYDLVVVKYEYTTTN
jgi:hypothetical protein